MKSKSSKKCTVEIPHNMHGQTLRIIFVVLPILKEFEPLSRPAYIISDAYYLFSCLYDFINSKDVKAFFKELATTALAVGYLFWTIIESDLGDKIYTTQDLAYNLYELISGHDITSGAIISYREVFEKIFNIFNDGLWLSSYYFFYIEIEALSYGVDMLSYLYYAIKDWNNNKKLEFLAGLAMTGIRFHNVISYMPHLRAEKTPPPIEEPLSTPSKPSKLTIKEFS